MKMEITFSMFCDMFERAGRSDQFTYGGKKALFDCLEEIDPDYSLDVVALCCEFQEFEDLATAKDELGIDAETDEEILDFLRDNTLVVSEDPLVIQNF